MADAARTDVADSLFDFHQWGRATHKPGFNGEWVRLGDVCEIINGYAFKSRGYVSDGIRIIRIANVQRGYLEDSMPCYYPASAEVAIRPYLLNEGDLLLSLTGNVGRVAYLPKEMLPAALNQRVACLRIKPGIQLDAEYLFHILNSDKFENDCTRSAKGLAQKNMSTKWLKDYLIPRPPICVQKQIASRFNSIRKMVEGTSNQLERLDDLVKSQFVEMFGNVSTTCRVQDVATTYNGDRGKNYPTADDKVLAGYPFINAGNLEGGKVSFDSMDYITAEKYQALSGGKIRKDDILYCLRGSLGKSAICDFDGGTIASSLMVIRANIDEVSPRYLFEALNTPDVIRQMHAADNGSSQPNLSAKSVKSYLIPLPSKELQQQFADFVARVDKLGFDCCREIVCCGVLFSSMSASLLCT